MIPSRSQYRFMPRSPLAKTFWLCMAVAALLFLPHCIIDAVAGGGYFHYAGDFNDQQIAFYQYANAFLKQGGSYSWATDLGSGFVNSYAFYLLGSPFFWLSMLAPPALVPWLMVPLLCLKFGVAGAAACHWARRWLRDDDWAILTACLYAFSGFSVYNIFFNHFLDVVALFPLLLAAFDDAVLDDRWGPLPVWVALNLLNNYFFFAGQAVFLVLYFFCLLASRRVCLTLRQFGRLCFEAVLGCALGCLLLVPAVSFLLQNPRTIDPFNGYGYLVYGKAQQYGAIFYSAFLMPDTPYLKDLFQEGVLKHTSMSVWLPLVGVAAGLAFCRAKRSHPFTYVLKCCVVCAFVPVLNSLFYALNSSYYARWYYMPVLLLCAASAMALQRPRLARAELPRALGLVAVITASAAAFALVPNRDADGNTTFGVVDNQLRFWGLWLVSMLSLALFAVLWRRWRSRPAALPKVLLAGVLAVALVFGSVNLSIGKYGQWQTDEHLIAETYDAVESLQATLPQHPENQDYRIDVFDGHNNLGLWLGQPCLQFFNSTVSPSIMEFYPTFGVKRDVNSQPKAELYALRALLGVRYTLVPQDSVEKWQEENVPGWLPFAETDAYRIYQNENWLPMGFVCDRYVTEEDLMALPEQQRAEALLKAVLLDETQQQRYADLVQPLPEKDRKSLDYETFAQDCAARRADAVSSFAMTHTGFTATMPARQTPALVVFSVPYEDGFTATVNGTETPVEKVDHGLCAIAVPAGEQIAIECRYRTPGLAAGLAVTLAAAAVYLVYLLAFCRRRRPGTAAA